MSLIQAFHLQLYSVRELAKENFYEVLQKTAEIGFAGVEFAGYENLPANEMRAALRQNHLESISTHVSMERLTSHLEEELDYNREIGTKSIVIPHYRMETAGDVEKLAGQIPAIAKAVRSAGLSLGYHNHAEEFRMQDGRMLLDLLMELTDPADLDIQLDVFWAAYAGIDVPDYMEKHKDRIRLLHLKQMDTLENKRCVDLGEGVLDFKKILLKGEEIGIKHYILEQEEFSDAPFTCLQNGYQYIMNL